MWTEWTLKIMQSFSLMWSFAFVFKMAWVLERQKSVLESQVRYKFFVLIFLQNGLKIQISHTETHMNDSFLASFFTKICFHSSSWVWSSFVISWANSPIRANETKQCLVIRSTILRNIKEKSKFRLWDNWHSYNLEWGKNQSRTFEIQNFNSYLVSLWDLEGRSNRARWGHDRRISTTSHLFDNNL